MIKIKDIIENKKLEIKHQELEESLDTLKERIKKLPPTIDFLSPLKKPGINIIAEIKIKSPSMEKKELNPLEYVKIYDESGVAAISVLTDEKYFGGTKELMQQIRNITKKPILRKDFIISNYQIYQSRAYGADAILLISQILDKSEIRKFIILANKLNMQCLIEFNNKEDLGKIPKDLGKIYGRNFRILNNNHNLEDNVHDDFKKDDTYINEIPNHAVKVAESSIKSKEDIQFLKKLGFDAFLIGSLFSKSKNIKQTIQQLTH